MVVHWKACIFLVQFLIIFQVYGVPDLVKLNEGDAVDGNAEEQFGHTVFNIKNNDGNCLKTPIGDKRFVKDGCGVYLDDIPGMRNEFSDFEFFLRDFNKDDGGGSGRARLHFNGFLSFGADAQNSANKGTCLRWDQSIYGLFLRHPKLNNNYLAPYWMRYFEGSVHIFKLEGTTPERSRYRNNIMNDLREGGFFTGKTHDNAAKIFVITWLRMASDGTLQDDTE
ncbi:uncharacterized protein [Clytia hemisphaerica]|uniref:uncharacterized protein n=1 Tax=Clytia hemisphaerica TaxID=252671 RepID=UPI0034D613AF